jgi:hypothetical protein
MFIMPPKAWAERVVAGTAEIFGFAILPVCADADDDETGIDREREFADDSRPFERAGRRRLHPHVGNLPERHQELDPPGILEVQTHGEPVLGDVRLVAAVFARAAG